MRERRGRYYVFERNMRPTEEIIVELPLLIYKNSLFDLGISSGSDEVDFFVTYSLYPQDKTAIWKRAREELSNKTVRAIKIINYSLNNQKVCLRIAF